MKNLIFIGITILMASCSMQRIDFSKRIPVISDNQEEVSPPEIFKIDISENTSQLSVINEEELIVNIDALPEEKTEASIETHSYEPVWQEEVPLIKKPNDKHNECKCFGKSLIMSGSTLAIMGVLTVFSWTTLGIGAFIIGALMVIIGIVIVKKL